MKLSVIVPVYNTGEYLTECLSSVPEHEGVEVIIIDDGSTDNTSSAICDRLVESRHDTIAVHTENRGLGGARMAGLSLARGEYVLFLDSDDLLARGALDRILSAAKKHSPDVIGFDFLIRENGRDTPDGGFYSDSVFTVAEHPEYLTSLPNVWTRAWKRELFVRTGITFPSRLYYEDLASVPALLASAGSLFVLPDALYVYRRREGSIMSSTDLKKNLGITDAFDKLLGHMERLGLTDACASELEWLAIRHVLLAASVRVLSCKEKDGTAAAHRLARYVRERFPRYEGSPYLSCLSPRQRLLFRALSRGNVRTARVLVTSQKGITQIKSRFSHP